MTNVLNEVLDLSNDIWSDVFTGEKQGAASRVPNAPKLLYPNDPREKIPDDVWRHVFENLTKAELVDVSTVSHAFKRVCDGDPRWKKFVEKRDIRVLDSDTPKDAAFAYCKRYNALFFRLLDSPFGRNVSGPCQIPLETQRNLFSAKEDIAERVRRSNRNVTIDLGRRLDNCSYGDPLSLEEIHLFLEGGAKLSVVDSQGVVKDITFNGFIASAVDAKKRLDAMLDQLEHPGSRRFGVHAIEFLRMMRRWKGRFTDMSEQAVARITEVGAQQLCSVRNIRFFQEVPVDFPKYRELVLSLCKYDPSVIRFVPKDLDDYLQLVLDAIGQNHDVLDELSDDLRTSPDFLRQAVMRNRLVLSKCKSGAAAVSDPVLYRELAELVFLHHHEIAGNIVWDAISEYQEFVTRVLDMMIQRDRLSLIGNFLYEIDPALVDTYQALVDKAVASYPGSIVGVRKNCVNNYRELLKSALARDATLIRWYAEVFEPEEYRIYATEAVRLDTGIIHSLDRNRLGADYYRELVITALRQNGMELMYLGEFAEDAEVVAVAVKQDPRAIEYACDRFKTDLTPLLRTCVHYKEAEQLFLARWCLKKELMPYIVDLGFATIARMAAKGGDCPKGEVERLLGRIRDSVLREGVRQTLGF